MSKQRMDNKNAKAILGVQGKLKYKGKEANGFEVNLITPFPMTVWEAFIWAMKEKFGSNVFFLNNMKNEATSNDEHIFIVEIPDQNEDEDDEWNVSYVSLADVEAIQSWRNPERKWGKYGRQYDYRCPGCAELVKPYYFAAANAIDWSIPAERIGDRKRPLKPRTMERIELGLKKFGNEWMILHTDHLGPKNTQPLASKMSA